MNRTKVSYLVALYNKQNLIEECIDSILSESNEEIEIEVCIVDDGSTDKSFEIVQKKYIDHQSVKLYSFNSNRGKNAAYNKAYSMSSGDYFCIFGADDVVVPGRTLILLKHSLNTGKSVYGHLLKFVDSKDQSKSLIKKLTENPNYKKNINQKNIRFEDIVMQNTLSGGCGLLKKQHTHEIFPIPEHLKFEDWWIAYHISKNEWGSVLSIPVTFYRIHEGNDNGSEEPNYESAKKDYLRHFDYLKEFQRIADSDLENLLIDKSLILRKSFFMRHSFSLEDIKKLGLDKHSLKILLFQTIGSKRYYNLRASFYRYFESKSRNN